MTPLWMPMAMSVARRWPKCAATWRHSDVAGPRPSSARTEAPSAAMPMSAPPPQSPVMSPRREEARRRPSGERPTQFMPAPMTTATPQPSSVRRAGRRTCRWRRDCDGDAQPSRARCSARSSTGRSAPAMNHAPKSATGPAASGMPACVACAVDERGQEPHGAVESEVVRRRSRPAHRGEHRAAGLSSATSVLELPPSTASSTDPVTVETAADAARFAASRSSRSCSAWLD